MPDEERVGHVGTARWNKWSLAGARELWQGRRVEREQERELDRGVRRGTVYEPKRAARPERGSRCQLCEHGTMRKRKVYRTRPAVVIIGYAALVVSLLGLALLATETLVPTDVVSGLTGIGQRSIEKVLGVAIAAATLGGAGALLSAIVWIVTGSGAWLVVRKRKLLRCNTCEATVPAGSRGWTARSR